MPLRDATRYTNFKHCFSTKTYLAFRAVRCGQKKPIRISSISILITILTHTDMLSSYKCILCEFETYFQRKPIRPFPKSCKRIHIYILYVCVSNQIQQNNMQHAFSFGHQVLILF